MKLLFPLLLLFQVTPIPSPSNAPVLALPQNYRNVVAIRNPDGTYIVHPNITQVKNLAIYRNGLRMTPGGDYQYWPISGIITPMEAWDVADTILLDFDL